MRKKKSIMVVTPRFPYPLIGGDRVRIYSICKELSEVYDLTLVSLCESKLEMHYTVPDDNVFARVERIYLPKWISYLNVLLNLFSSLPMQIAYYRSDEFSKIVENMSKRHDLVLCHLIRSGQYVADLNIPKILEMTDAISLNYKRIKENSEIRGYKATLYRIEQKRLEAYEKAIVTKFNYCSLISSVDRDYIYGDGVEPKNSVIVGNGVTYSDLPYQFVQSIAPNTTKRLIFIGVVTTVQNWDALYWFAKQVMPILLQQGDYRLDVVGRIDRDKEKILDIIPGIRVVGTVGSIPEATKGGLVGICPMRIGAGVQTKVLEYMSLGLPCVISSLALEGIEATPNQDVLVAKTPREYADAIIRLTEDRVYASRISTSARLVAEEKYSWRSRLQPLLESIDKLLQSGS